MINDSAWPLPRILALQSHTNWREPDGHTPSDRALYAKYLYSQGLSASQIASRLGGNISRNAVIGILHRLGWAESRVSYNRPAQRPPRRQRKIKPANVPAKPAARPAFASKGNPAVRALFKDEDMQPIRKSFDEIGHDTKARKTLIELTADQCRWPLGPVMERSTHFCGCKVVQGLSWCMEHARRVYAPVQPRSVQPSNWNVPSNSARGTASGQNGVGGDMGSQNLEKALKTALEGADQ